MMERDYLQHSSLPNFERGIGPAETHAASSPVRNIPVTSAMREADARRHVVVSSTALAWRAKVFGRGPAPARPPEKKPQTAHLVTKPRQSMRTARPCTELCGRVTNHSTGRCGDCRRKRSTEEVDRSTGIRVGWSTPEAAPTQEETTMVDQIATSEPEVVHSVEEPAGTPTLGTALQTLLETEDESEHEANLAWKALSAEDKWALLEAVR